MIETKGIGLHSGQQGTVRFFQEEGPVRFVLQNKQEIRPLASNVVSTNRCTVLGKNGAQIALVEHLLAAMHILQIWEGVLIEVEGPEIPILDGSSLEWLGMLEGFTSSPVTPFLLDQEFREKDQRTEVFAVPAKEFFLTSTIMFSHPRIGYQKVDSPPVPIQELAAARTFGFLSEAEGLKSQGLALGLGDDNAVIFSEADAISALRVADEPVRHKALDFLGDLYLVGAPIVGRFAAHRGSHRAHVGLALQLEKWVQRQRELVV